MTNLTKKQKYAQSCGAACLLVSALELGITETPKNFTKRWFGKALTLDDSSETELYSHTAGTALKGYSLPSKLCVTAKELGFNVTIYLHGKLLPTLMTKYYPNEENACNSAGIPVVYGPPPTIDAFSRLLCVVGIGGGLFGTHYVLYRDDGTYMDPAYGTNYKGTLWGMGQAYVLRYVDLGIYIHLTIKNTIHMV